MDKIKELKPDVVIGDMLAAPAFVVADQIKVPSLINNPGGSYSLYQGFGLEKLPDLKKAKSSCGRIIVSQTSTVWLMKMVLDYYFVSCDTVKEARRMWNYRTAMYQSFWGFEEAQVVPPNIVLTGPVAKPLGDL